MKKLLFLFTALIILSCSTDDGGVTPPKETPVEVSLKANDDAFTTAENTALEISGLLENDTIDGYARIKTFDSETMKGGEVVDNRNGTYTYTPPTDFMGEDSFEYTLCDNADSPNCSTASVVITITSADPVAVDDSYTTTEEKPLNITTYTNNDQLLDNAVVTSIDSEASSGSVTMQDDGDIVYTPADGFTGDDSFTYTICDDDETPSCSTATITITVIDEGTPVANDDVVSMAAGESQLVITNVLANDELIDDAKLVSVDVANHGSVVLNADGTITYTAEAGYVGEATFTYTLCDDDAQPTCVTGEVTVKIVETVSFNIPSELDYYYSDVVFSGDSDVLYQELSAHTNEKHVNKLEYYMRHDYLYDADADLTDPFYVVMMYSGDLRPWTEHQEGDLDGDESFNTEHIYPQSLLGDNEEAKNDMHHMRSADAAINSQRLNYPFTEGSGTYELIDGDSWYPGDEWKGDVARMVMYINLKYGEPFSDVGNLEMFLRWNVEDPVSAFEIQRNNVIEGAQGNRNPFIDNPYLATLIWGGESATNTWE
ncbi:MAG: Ig-like domain-containing protein [Salinimicrobium sp.]